METKLHLIFFLICIIFYKNVVKCNDNNFINRSYNKIKRDSSKLNNFSLNDKDVDNKKTEEYLRKRITDYKNYLLRLKSILDSKEDYDYDDGDDKDDEDFEENLDYKSIENKNNKIHDNKNDNSEMDSIDEKIVEGNDDDSNEHDRNRDNTRGEDGEKLDKYVNFQELNKKYMESQENSEDENNDHNRYETASYDEESDTKKVLNDYDMKILEKIREISIRASRTDVNYFKDIDKEFKESLDKHDASLTKMAEKVKKDLGGEKMNNKEYVMGKLENILNQINKDYIEKDNFDMQNYLPDLKFINFYLLNIASENYDSVVASLNDINSRIELSSIDGIINSFVKNKNINNKIKQKITDIITNTSIKYFMIEVNKNKLLLPALEYHSNKSLYYLSDVFFKNNKICEKKICPSNSNCYVIGNEEMCRCFPGFKELIEGDTHKCVKDNRVDCMKNNGGCDSNAKCTLKDMNILCECNANYDGDGIYCSNAFFNTVNFFILLVVLIFNLYIL